jgi:hypothetical protein
VGRRLGLTRTQLRRAGADSARRARPAHGGDLDGTGPFVPPGHHHLQLPVTRFETIAQMRARGLTDDDVVAAYLGDVEEHPDYCCLYEHPDDLGSAELAVFDRVFAAVARSGREVVTLGEVARRVAGAPPARP